MDEHIKAWVAYNQHKHKISSNPHKFRNRITDITNQSKNFDFDPNTRNWFTISDQQLSTMTIQQIHSCINKACALRKKCKKTRNRQVLH